MTQPTRELIRAELLPLEERLGEIERAHAATLALANAKPISIEQLARYGLLESLEAVVDRRLKAVMAAALADPNLGDAAAGELDDHGPELDAALRKAAAALAGYTLAWLEQHPPEAA